jgi:hypothetical protein
MSQGADSAAPEEPASSDLVHELQFQTFNQVATLSTAGAGLSLTLAGTMLGSFTLPVWLSVFCFACSALVCLQAQVSGVQLLFDKKPSRRTLYAFARVAVFLMAIGIGALGTGVAITTLENRQLASDASR